MKELKFFKCNQCGEVIVKLIDKKESVTCCDEKMQELVCNVVDASQEKHLPVVNLENGFVNIKVGSIPHPMEETHFINFVAVVTENGYIIKTLSPNKEPEANIFVGDEKVIAVYEYCSLHGLWKTSL